MKRRYKAGDWVRIPLGGEHDAAAIIARACRSRLFGYFFAVPASRAPSHDELRAFSAKDALCAMLFGAAPIEQARWEMLATSLAFDPQLWPLTDFAERGAFGEAWTRVRYDPETLQVASRETIDAHAASTLSDARFAGPHEVETMLRNHLAGVPGASSYSVWELRSPLDPEQLRPIERGGRAQFSTPLSACDLAVLLEFIDAHPHVELRVHGFRRGFDARTLAPFRALQALVLEVKALQHSHALCVLQSLRTLQLGSMQIDLRFLQPLHGLRVLQLRGTRADLEPVTRLPDLQSLLLENTAPLALEQLACAQALNELTLSHGTYELGGLRALRSLRTLRLRALEMEALPDLSELVHLAHLELSDLPIADLAAVASAPQLRVLHVSGMPHLNVSDFAALQRCAGLQISVEIGSKTKAREVYRLLKSGNT